MNISDEWPDSADVGRISVLAAYLKMAALRGQHDEVTEVALLVTATGGLRRDLVWNRNLHLFVTTSICLAFLGVIAVSFWLAAQTSESWLRLETLVGGSGTGGVLGAGTFIALQRTRKAFYALSLQESYLEELDANLIEAKRVQSPNESQKLRATAWRAYRFGIRDLWIRELRSEKSARNTASRGTNCVG